MMRYIVKRASIDPDDGSHYFDVSDIVGRIQLFEEGDTVIPTDIYILVGNFSVTGHQRMKSKDKNMFNGKIDFILKRSKAKLSHYGKDRKRKFYMGIKVPKEVIDGYTG